jgi:hypothetical protein
MSVPLRSASPIRTPSVAAAEIIPSTPIVTPQTSPTTSSSAAKIPARSRSRFGDNGTVDHPSGRAGGHGSPSRFERRSPPIEPVVGGP